ncbi:MAG: hypothetical protein Q9197_002574 [Variospora fuerteventurae]
MFLQQTESAGPAQGPPQDLEKPLKKFIQESSSLPFGQSIPLASISGPTYVTAQTLIQHVAYSLSDRLWTYSPEKFDLDVAVKRWSEDGVKNVYGYSTSIESMQTRCGAASIAMGYMFSKDFDFNKRDRPQTILASSSCLPYLHSTLDQLYLLYPVANPTVVHAAAINFGGASSALVTDYISTLTLAEELGYGVVVSLSAYESQHMSLFATLLANITPTIHTYDGVAVGRDTTRVIHVLDQAGLYEAYKAVSHAASSSQLRKDSLDKKVEHLLDAFNRELATDYGLFEYHGHESADVVLITFGSVESSLGSLVASSLGQSGSRIGVLNVRVYRPFVEQAFLRLLPRSAQIIGVLGQVNDTDKINDQSVNSVLYTDVIAAISFSGAFQNPPTVRDIKYSREKVWTQVSIAAAFQLLLEKPVTQGDGARNEVHDVHELPLLDPTEIQQYTFWDIQDSPSATAPLVFGAALAKESSSNVTTRSRHENLVLGGLVKTEIRNSKQTVDAPYFVGAADLVYVGEPKLLDLYDTVAGLKPGGKMLIKLSAVKADEIYRKLPEIFRKNLSAKAGELFIFDPSSIDMVADDLKLETYLLQIAFLRVGLSNMEKTGIGKLASINASPDLLTQLAAHLESALRKIEVPEDWKTIEVAAMGATLPVDIKTSDFVSFDKTDYEPPTYLKDWKTAAQGLAFKEAYQTKTALRPDLAVKTHTVRVAENRRLTPLTYERNIFHIEFDLGYSDLKYEIGEALGIHAENDEVQVEEFIRFYRLNPKEVVEVPSREDASILENRTVWQALMQNIDIFGRPPKRFYEALAEFAEDPSEKHELQALGGPEGATEFKRRAEVDTITYADVLLEFPSAHPDFHDIVRIVNPMKRREYSIASCQKVTPNSVALMIVVVGWVDPKGRDRFGQATRFLNKLSIGAPVTVSIKPSVMKLPPKSTQPLIMAGLGTGLAPFRAFVQHRAWEKAQGQEIGSVLLYMGSRHQREEYCYGEEWEAYQDAGVITLLGRAFSRDQPEKIYIQDRMRQTMGDIIQAYLKEEGAFYLCGPTWPVPDVTNVLEDAIARDAKTLGKKTDPHREIERLKDQLRYVLEAFDLLEGVIWVPHSLSASALQLAQGATKNAQKPQAEHAPGPMTLLRSAMPYHDSPSPAKRPQLVERSSSTNSLPRASPSTGKGSTTRLHRPHAVGHTRHGHGRIPSYGRNLNKLTKLTALQAQEESNRAKDQSRTKAQTPSTSPSSASVRHSSSSVTLTHTNPKVSIKRNASNLSQKRNKSSSKLGHLAKHDKTQRKKSDTTKVNGAHFSMGSDQEDDEDDGWTEAGSSQSPQTTRRGSFANGQAQLREPPSPDGPPLKSATHLPVSPPQSPPTAAQETARGSKNRKELGNTNADVEIATNQLLIRNTALNAKPQMSDISATITPSGSSGSPAFNFGRDARLRHDQSMPSDGISRFLDATGSSSGHETPASLSQLNSALAEIHKTHELPFRKTSAATADRNPSTDQSDQARSTPNPKSFKQELSTLSRSSSPPNQPSARPSFTSTGPSPFAARRAGQSRTQEKLNLQREAATREPAHPPVVQPASGGVHPSAAELRHHGHEGSIEELKIRDWARVEAEYENARGSIGFMGKGLERLDKRGKIAEIREGKEGRDGGRKVDRNLVVSMSAESRPESRGRVRFEVGRSHGGESFEADVESDAGGLEGLLRRMWEGDGQCGGED